MEWFFDFILEWILGAIIVVILFAWAIHRGNELEKIRKGEQAQKTVIEQKECIGKLLKENLKLKDEAELAKTYKIAVFDCYVPCIKELQERIEFYESLHPELKELPPQTKTPSQKGD